jgi:hypothetical protein
VCFQSGSMRMVRVGVWFLFVWGAVYGLFQRGREFVRVKILGGTWTYPSMLYM